MIKRYQVLLLGILLIAAILRIYQLDKIPPSLEWDEVATGYDAYSILKTGRDQFGHLFPLAFRSIDDYKPPLYTYLTSLSIAVLGWNDFAVRFPAAFLGILAVLTTYGVTYELFRSRSVAQLSGLFLAISPWHVNFSRLALETNSTVFFTTAGVWAFFKGIKADKSGKWLIVASILLGLDLYLYHNARVFVPLLGLVLGSLYWRELWQQKGVTILASIVAVIFVARLIPIVTSVTGQMRFQGTSIFGIETPTEIDIAKNKYAQWRILDTAAGIPIYGKLFHNQYVLYGLRLLRNYLSHFSPTFLLFTDDYPRHHMPEMGLLYFVDLPLFIVGWYFLAKQKDKRIFMVVLAWFLFAPIPSAVTRDVPHALRSEIFLPIFQISISLGVVGIYSLIYEKKLNRRIFLTVVGLAYFLNVSFFMHKFLFVYARETSQYWQYGRREAIQFTEAAKHDYERVLVSTRIEQPHVFWLYYSKYDPATYLAEGGTVSGGWNESRNHFDKYQFRRFDYTKESDGMTLFVGLPSEFPRFAPILYQSYYLDGTEALRIVKG